MVLYCGEVDSTRAEGVHGLDHEGEDILVHVVPWGDLLQRLQRGEINSATPLLGVQWLQMNRERLQRKWRGDF